MDAVTAANYKAGVTAAGVGMELTLYSHFLIPVASTEMIL
jgi:hypothetical protein